MRTIVSGFRLPARFAQQAVNRVRELFVVDWLFEAEAGPQVCGHFGDICKPGNENEGDPALGEEFRDGQAVPAEDLDIEDGGVEFGFRSELEPLFDGWNRADDGAADHFQHRLCERGDEKIIFDQKNTVRHG